MSEERAIYSLKQVANSITKVMQQRYNQSYWVKAEIYKLNHTNKGHCFPELVEKENGKTCAEMKGIIWASNFNRINLNFVKSIQEPLKDGIEVLMKVNITFNAIYGLTLEIADIDPSFSLGALQRKKMEAIAQLKQMGIFDLNKRLSLTQLPKKFAIISIATSKGFQDFTQIINENTSNYYFYYQLFPAILNGDAAIKAIQNQLAIIEKSRHKFDCVLIIRGGGGEIGMSCYDDVQLAEKIARFPLPVFTGIGHSTNETVCEMIAYKNAITPSALANYFLSIYQLNEENLKTSLRKISELSNRLIEDKKQQNTNYRFKLNRLVQRQLQTEEHIIYELQNGIKSEIKLSLRDHKNNLIKLNQGINNHSLLFLKINTIDLKKNYTNTLKASQRFIQKNTNYIFDTKEYLEQSIHNKIKIQEENLDFLHKRVQLMNPENILKRGFSMILDHNGKLINENTLKKGQQLKIINYSTTLNATLDKIERNEKN